MLKIYFSGNNCYLNQYINAERISKKYQSLSMQILLRINNRIYINTIQNFNIDFNVSINLT